MWTARPPTPPGARRRRPAPAKKLFLLVEGLPPDCRRRELGHVLRNFPGVMFMEVYAPRGGRARGSAAVRFETEERAREAARTLDRYPFDAAGREEYLLTTRVVAAADSPLYDPEANYRQ